MEWESLLGDLESQFEAAQEADLGAEVAELTRGEWRRQRLVDRLRAARGLRLSVGLGDAPQGGAETAVDGRLLRVGPDWLLLGPGEAGIGVASAGTSGPAGEVLVPLSAVRWLEGLPAVAVDPAGVGPVESRLDLRTVLHRLVRDRALLLLTLRGTGPLHGVLDRVGADYLEVALVPLGEERRARSVRRVRLVPLPALVSAQRR